MGQHAETVYDLDAPAKPGAVPESTIGDILKWAPIIQEFIVAIKAAIAGGALKVPDIHLRLFGKRVTLMTTLKIEP
jgi:hypothetical protein